MMLRHPLLLLLLLLVPLLLWLRYGRKRQAALPYSNGAALAALPRSPWLAFQWLRPALFAAALVCLVIALARPQKGLTESRVETEGVDIVLLIDTSTSMRAEDLSTATRRQNRLDAAKAVVTQFIDARPDDRIGIVIFAAMPYTIAPLTTDHPWLLKQLDRIQTGMLEDSTAIGDAMASAINRLRDSSAKSKLVVLLTDGINNSGQMSPTEAAQAAAALDIKVYVVGAAAERPQGGGFFQLNLAGPEIDDAALTKIAETTGGQYFRATNFKRLEAVYKQIDEMEKTKIEMSQFTRYEEKFMSFALAALILLALELAAGFTRLGRPL